MKKLSLDERLYNMKPSDTPLLWIGYTLLFMMLLIPMGCSHVELIEGLCYNDRDGTYLCMEPDPVLEEEPKPIIIDDPIIEDENLCEIWRNVDDPEAYMNCILVARKFEDIA